MEPDQSPRDYEEGGGDKGYYERGADVFASFGFPIGLFQASPDAIVSSYPARSPASPDSKVSVVSSSKAQPVFSSSKKEGSVFAVSPIRTARTRIQSTAYPRLMDRVLRSITAVCSLVAFCVMCSTREMRAASGSTFEVKFSDFHAYYYFVAVHVLSFVYSSVQVGISQSRSSSSSKSTQVPSLRLGIWKYFCDGVMALCLISATSSAATAAELSYVGLPSIWPPACSTWKLWTFCLRAQAVVIISFVSSLSIILSSLLSLQDLLAAQSYAGVR